MATTVVSRICRVAQAVLVLAMGFLFALSADRASSNSLRGVKDVTGNIQQLVEERPNSRHLANALMKRGKETMTLGADDARPMDSNPEANGAIPSSREPSSSAGLWDAGLGELAAIEFDGGTLPWDNWMDDGMSFSFAFSYDLDSMEFM